MPRMIELIRQSAVPANVLRSAARGALALPSAEMIEILVHLTKNPVFAQEASVTLAGWDEDSSRALVSDPSAPKEVLEYFSQPGNLRPRLLPALLENPSITDHRLADMAHDCSREVIGLLLASPRVQHGAKILHALAGNQRLETSELQRVHELLASMGEPATAVQPEESESYEARHADEIAAEQGKPFTLITATGDVLDLGFEELDTPPANDPGVTALEVLPVLEAKAAQSSVDPNVQKRVSTLFRIAKLSVGERIQLAMKGSREERFILVRDGAKVVALAVLESPKLSESEVESFASMRNVQEAVLRTIALKRRFMKLYGVVKALVNNPRTPLDVSLPLLGHLMVNDLKTLSVNKNINDTLRKLAIKLHRQKSVAAGGGR